MTTRTMTDVNREIKSLEASINAAERAKKSAKVTNEMHHRLVGLRRERIRLNVKKRNGKRHTPQTTRKKSGGSPSSKRTVAPSLITPYKEHENLADWCVKEIEEITSLARARAVFDAVRSKTDQKVYALADALDKGSAASEGAVTAAVKLSDVNRLRTIIDKRTSDPLFLASLEFRNQQRSAYRSTKHAFVYLKNVKKGDRKTECEDKDTAKEVTYDEIRASAFINLNEYERLHFLNEYISRYKTVTARAVARLEDILIARDIADGTAVYYEEDELHGMTSLGAYESGSREWLESRQGGIGGSDVGAIMKVDPDFGYENHKAAFESKTEPITDEQVEYQYGEDFTTATGRGNAWEEVILRTFIEKNPEEQVVRCKTSWSATWLWKHIYANFDGLLRDPVTGEIDGIVEIKTASDPSKWGDVSEGLDGVPDQYRKQVLWYMLAAGLTRGVVLVMIDDHEYREYWFSMSPSLAEEQENIIAATQGFWKEVEACRKDPEAYKTVRRMSIPKSALAPSATWDSEKRRTVAQNLMAYRDENIQQLENAHWKILEEEYWGGATEGTLNADILEDSIRSLYTNFDPSTRKRPLIGIDIETSGFAPQMGRIIELGLSVWKYDSTQPLNYKETKSISRLYGLPRKAEESTGTGMVDVHHIEVDDVKGKPLFGNPQNVNELLAIFQTGVLVFHNASFEDNWFRIHVPGYAELRDEGKILVLDTMLVSRHLYGHLIETKNHKLQSFVERFGDEYLDAHRAYKDVMMMMTALAKSEIESAELREELYKETIGV